MRTSGSYQKFGQCPNGEKSKLRMGIGIELAQRRGLQPDQKTLNTKPKNMDCILWAKGHFRPGSNVTDPVLWEDYFDICDGDD